MNQVNSENKIPFEINGKMKVCIFENEEQARNSKSNLLFPIKQIHADKIVFIKTGEENLFEIDGLITDQKVFALGVKTSDCAAVCLADDEKIGIMHVGWRGLINDIFVKAVENFNKKKITVYVSPFLHEFEIQRDFCFDELKAKFGEKFFEKKEGKLFFNFKNALVSILPENTVWDSRNIKDDLSLPSNRRGDKYNFVTTVEFIGENE
jgi:copper oxidase (laccase) domain-containing protein